MLATDQYESNRWLVGVHGLPAARGEVNKSRREPETAKSLWFQRGHERQAGMSPTGETPAAEPTVLDEWKQAIIDGLVVAEIYRNEHEIAPKPALNELIAWHCQIASSAGPDLREQIEQLEKWAAMEYAPCHYNADAADGWADGYRSAIGAVLALLDAAKER